MKKIICIFTILLLSAAASQAEENTAHEQGKWEKAGAEISEAAHAVGDATVDSSKKGWKATKETSAEAWDATKEGSAEAWDATKEGSAKAWDATKEESVEAWDATKNKSHDMWEKGKAKVHEATAPEELTVEQD